MKTAAEGRKFWMGPQGDLQPVHDTHAMWAQRWLKTRGRNDGGDPYYVMLGMGWTRMVMGDRVVLVELQNLTPPILKNLQKALQANYPSPNGVEVRIEAMQPRHQHNSVSLLEFLAINSVRDVWAVYASKQKAALQARLLQKEAKVTDEQKRYLTQMMQPVVEEESIGDYDLILSFSPLMNMYQIGMQREGQDFTDLNQQFDKVPNLPAVKPSAMKPTIDKWLHKYKTLWVASHDERKTRIYKNLLTKLGYHPEVEDFMGIELVKIEA